ncbi:MAG TPA: CheR family methyltransferase [Anaerolineae bacterium]|nr:CheR family methyltransferase [Anaerolineae bacterium]
MTTQPLRPFAQPGVNATEAPPANGKGIPFTQADYERFRNFVLERIGLNFPEDKRAILGRGLAQVMHDSSCANLDQLYTRLRNNSTTSEVWERLISVLTVGETYFFRNSSHFVTLAKHILPEIMSRQGHSSRRIRIWSAGCATGEEPYSLAILLRELIPNLDSWNILILATDINREALVKAQAGQYSAWSFRGVDKRIQETYFHPQDKLLVIGDEIKRMVTFDYLNLVGDPYPSLANNTTAMDLILCRNVTIYFNPTITVKVVHDFHTCLVDGGWLMPGPAEPNMVFYGDFDARNFPGAVVYQKSATPRVPLKPTGPLLPHVPPFVVTPPERRQSSSAASQPIAATAQPKPAAIRATVDQAVTAPAGPQPGQPPAPDRYARALEHLHAGRIDKALSCLYRKLDEDARFTPAYYTLGKIYANQGDLGEAQQWCERAIKLDKLLPEPYYTLSMIYQQNGLLEPALESLKKAIYLDRQFILAHYNLAQIYQRQGEIALARKSLQNVRQLLDGKPREMLIPEGDGLNAGRLLELINAHLEQLA